MSPSVHWRHPGEQDERPSPARTLRRRCGREFARETPERGEPDSSRTSLYGRDGPATLGGRKGGREQGCRRVAVQVGAYVRCGPREGPGWGLSFGSYVNTDVAGGRNGGRRRRVKTRRGSGPNYWTGDGGQEGWGVWGRGGVCENGGRRTGCLREVGTSETHFEGGDLLPGNRGGLVRRTGDQEALSA